MTKLFYKHVNIYSNNMYWLEATDAVFAIYNHETIGTVACRSITLRDRRTP